MLFRTVFGSRKQNLSRRRAAPRGGPRRLAIEALEGREVPASLTLGDAVIMEGHTGIQEVAAVVSFSESSASIDGDPRGSQTPSKQNASGWIADPVGDILPTYTGAQLPGMDVIAHRVMVLPNRVIFSGRMAGPIAPTQEIGGLYIIGVDRGQGTPRFAGRTPVIGPNVLWDSVVRVNPNGTGLFNNIVTGVITPLNPEDIEITGNEFTASVPLSLLMPGATQPPEEWIY